MSGLPEPAPAFGTNRLFSRKTVTFSFAEPYDFILSLLALLDVSINSVVKLLIAAGNACSDYQDKALRNLNRKRIQCDEIWSFVVSTQ